MTSTTAFDAIIVGGGLAGLSASIVLAQQGHRVAVLEKDSYPKHKVCGEYISYESWQFIERLGLPLSTMGLPRITRLHATDTRGTNVYAALPQGGFGISRHRLDAALAEAAMNAGVTVITHARVDNITYSGDKHTVSAGGREYTAAVVCGTWGKRSNIDVKWQRAFIQEKSTALSNYIGIKYHIRYPWPKDTVALYNFADGYCGVSPIEDDRTCFCYLTTAANLRNNGNDIKQLEQNVLAKNPQLKELLTKSEFLYQQPLAISQISFEKKELVMDHVLMLGDAAGMITPLCGNGMSIAFHSAKLGAEQVSLFLSGQITRDAMEQQYSGAWKRHFSSRISMGRAVQSVFGGELSTTLFLNAVKVLPVVKRALIRRTSGTPF